MGCSRTTYNTCPQLAKIPKPSISYRRDWLRWPSRKRSINLPVTYGCGASNSSRTLSSTSLPRLKNVSPESYSKAFHSAVCVICGPGGGRDQYGSGSSFENKQHCSMVLWGYGTAECKERLWKRTARGLEGMSPGWGCVGWR